MYSQELLDQEVAQAQAAALAGITSGMNVPGGIPGATPAEQLKNLINAIQASPACENNIEKYLRCHIPGGEFFGNMAILR